MPVIIKEIHIRTVVERHVVAATDIPDEVITKIENSVVDRLSGIVRGQPAERRRTNRNKER